MPQWKDGSDRLLGSRVTERNASRTGNASFRENTLFLRCYVLKQGVWQPVLAAGSDITLNEFLTSYVQMVYSCTTSHSYQIWSSALFKKWDHLGFLETTNKIFKTPCFCNCSMHIIIAIYICNFKSQERFLNKNYHTTILSYHPYILYHFANYALCFVCA